MFVHFARRLLPPVNTIGTNEFHATCRLCCACRRSTLCQAHLTCIRSTDRRPAVNDGATEHQQGVRDLMLTRCLTIVVFLAIPLALYAEETPRTDQAIPVSAAVHKLDGVTSRVAAYLKAVPSFQVEATTQWTLDGARTGTGGARYQLSVQHPAAFRLEIPPRSDDGPRFICASDGRTLTRFYQSGPLAIFSRQDGGIAQLQDDAFTNSSLKGSGLDVIIRPDVHHYLMSSVTDVKDCGEQEWQGRRSHRFSANWFGGARVDLWIAADHEPVLLRWKRTQSLNIAGETHEVQIDSQLKWSVDAESTVAQAAVQMPEDVAEVKDLQTFLLRGGTQDLLGQAAPAVPLKLLDGSAWDLAGHRGKCPVVLIFFATWAAPSTHDMPTVLKFVNDFAERGVAFYSIAVGETPATVRSFVKAEGYAHPVVVDVEQQAARKYGITSLPVTVLIGKDGTLQAAHVGSAPEQRALIRQDLERLLEGKQLVNAKK